MMTLSGALSLVEKSSGNEAQDSQAVLEALQAELVGAGADGGSQRSRYLRQASAAIHAATVTASLPENVVHTTYETSTQPRVASGALNTNQQIIPASYEVEVTSRPFATERGEVCPLPRVPGSGTTLDLALTTLEKKQQAEERAANSQSQAACALPDPNRDVTTDTAASAESPPECHDQFTVANSPSPPRNHHPAQSQSRPAAHDDDTQRSLARRREALGAGLVRKMEDSQQTPTQPNEDRDYNDEVPESLTSTAARENATQNKHDDNTLHDDETGAVNFANVMSEPVRPSSQISEDGGFENTRGEWRVPDNTSQHINSFATPFKPHGIAPETPAMPKNPFAARHGGGAPFAGSQLFGQTQLSSAIKNLSPTSSRPSPNLMPDYISPNIAETSPLKNRTNVSPQVPMSTPQRHTDEPGTVTRNLELTIIDEETPSNSRSTREDIEVPASPTNQNSKVLDGFRPLDQYESVQRSQDRKIPTHDMEDLDSDDEATKKAERHKKAARQRAKAKAELDRVSYTAMTRPDSTDGPSSKRRKLLSKAEDAGTPVCSGVLRNPDMDAVISDSQKRSASSVQPTADQSTQGTETNDDDQVQLVAASPEGEAEAIPVTSPAASQLEQSQSEPELPQLKASGRNEPEPSNGVESSSAPIHRPRTLRTYGRSRQVRRAVLSDPPTSNPAPAHPETGAHIKISPSSLPPISSTSRNDEAEAQAQQTSGDVLPHETDTDSKPLNDQTEPSDRPALITTRSRGKQRSLGTPPLTENGAQAPTSSTSTSLSPVPSGSTETTPATRYSPSSDRPNVAGPSPSGRRNLRKQTAVKESRSSSPVSVTKGTRASTRLRQVKLESISDMHTQLAASYMDKSAVHGNSIKSMRLNTARIQNGIFQGMLFAVSMLSSPEDKSREEERIVKAGGIILRDGFEELFEKPPSRDVSDPEANHNSGLSIAKAFTEAGFTALIADGHSRTNKYLQALALGLPCLAHQWITACIEKSTIVDWEPYMLCAGASSVLGNALRSRTLHPFDAEMAQLGDIIRRRRILLKDQKVLVVMAPKQPKSEAKHPYRFFMRALGPSVSRVQSTQQAEATLAKHAKAGMPFDWVYVESASDPPGAGGGNGGGGKKRKRRQPAAPATWWGSHRILNEEVIIQSLILGRMLEAGEATLHL